MVYPPLTAEERQLRHEGRASPGLLGTLCASKMLVSQNHRKQTSENKEPQLQKMLNAVM